MSLTAIDYEEIKQLLARYGQSIDLQDSDGLVSCFHPDGSFEGPTEYYRGRDAIRAFCAAVGRRNVGHVRHHILTAMIAGDTSTARAVSLGFFTRDFGVPTGRRQTTHSAALASGYYSDTLVRWDDKWVFASRQFTFDGTPEALERLGKPLTIPPVEANHDEVPDATGMTALDYEAIRQLLYRYSYTIDFQDIDGVLGCFTPDGTFEVPSGSQEGGSVVRGTEGLRSFAKAVGEAGCGLSRHAPVGIVIEGNGEKAIVSSYCLNPMTYLYGFVPIGDGFGERHNVMFGKSGIYRDEVVKVDGRWLISRRSFGFDGWPSILALVGKRMDIALLGT